MGKEVSKWVLLSVLLCQFVLFTGCSDEIETYEGEVPLSYTEKMGFFFEAEDIIAHLGDDLWPGISTPQNYSRHMTFPNSVELTLDVLGYNQDDFSKAHDYESYSLYVKNPNFEQELQPLYFSHGMSYRIGSQYVVDVTLAEVPPIEEMFTGPDIGPEEIAYYNNFFSIEQSVATFIHELFHSYQEMVWTKRPYDYDDYDRFAKIGYIPFTDQQGHYNRIEQLSLLSAYVTADLEQKKKYIADYLTARRLKYKGTKNYASIECYLAKLEGMASYADIKVLSLLKNYKSSHFDTEDAFFNNYENTDYLYNNQMCTLSGCLTLKQFYKLYTFKRYYELGALQCFVLDQVDPQWAQNFDWNGGETLDSSLEKAVAYVPQEEFFFSYPDGVDERINQIWLDRYK